MAIKEKSLFWKIFMGIAIGLAVALVIWLIFLYNWLLDFESSQPKYVADKAFSDVFDDFNAKKFIKLCNASTDMFITEEELCEIIDLGLKDKDIYYKKVSSGMDESQKYVLYAGEDSQKFAAFYLVEDTEKKGRFAKYKLDKYELYLNYFTKDLDFVEIVCEIPRGYQLSVNGIEIGESFITEKDIPTDSCEHMPEGVDGLYYNRYTVENVPVSTVSIEVTNHLGVACNVMNENGMYKVYPEYDSALKAEYSEWILEGAELYAKYTQYDWRVSNISFSQVAPYFDPSSELYDFIKTVDNDFVIEYDSFSYTEMEADEFIKYNDDTFSCRVTYVQTLIKGREEFKDHIDQTLYLRKVDGKFLIYDMSVN